ncbi:MAG TPA: anthranilate synthase component I family protein [Miltoncostaeaceae bacterium]|nr:anthranilate synthase component I family protein [Miltoncostaeaceae bacterium]
MRHGATPSAGDVSAGILTHAEGVAVRALAGPVDPVAALAALAGRERPALVRHGGVTAVAADPAEVVVGRAAWEALARPPEPRPHGAAMAGGWIGLLAYDLGGTVERLPEPRPDPGGPPLAALARYDTVALIDDDGRCLVASAAGERELDELAATVAGAAPLAPLPPPVARQAVTSLPGDAYRAAVEAARELIRAGDCYQINVAQRLTVPWDEPPLALARRLWSAAGPAARRAYLALPEGAVASASPELLVSLRDGVARSEPIKGTAPLGMAGELAVSAKDRAEHVMIVDLVRNDLGRVARPGGVRVARLFDALPTPYVEHLVSEVVADLREDAGPRELLRAVFPGGSVTGCPKVRAMEVIRDLEPVARGPAYGSVVALGADGSLEASVAIRTAWVTGGEARYWCGGAVVWDSDPGAERAEAWAKAAPFLSAIGG